MASFSSKSLDAHGLQPGWVTSKKSSLYRRRFSRTTGIKDNPIRLGLILGELHFSSAKYYVMPLLLYTLRQPDLPLPFLPFFPFVGNFDGDPYGHLLVSRHRDRKLLSVIIREESEETRYPSPLKEIFFNDRLLDNFDLPIVIIIFLHFFFSLFDQNFHGRLARFPGVF